MADKNKWIVIFIIIGIIFGFGMFYQKNAPQNFPTFSTITTTRDCPSWIANQGLPSTTTVPFNWQYTTSQNRCVTNMVNSGGCIITYSTGACNTSICTPNWQCTAWSTCSSGTQSRTCTDLNNCGGTNPNPLTQTCTPTTGACTPGQKQCYVSNNLYYQNCLSNGQWSGILSCPTGQLCSGGNCVVSGGCKTSADTNCDNKVDRMELGTSINSWIVGSITRDALGEIITAWMTS
jgi:hypothetical protein